ncbi:MAG: tRNA (adenosine(37)-N6)-dimethylallyltransferase MiaA [Bacteroidia bacterium]|nr:tRNA (adenosine(37)-N6)-dimethylallyltransferase MiaA [Bacteroidia bacterium]
MNQTCNTIIITGPTASGKTALAVRLAAALNGAIISADSRQVYKNLNIGTGKDLFEYEVNGTKIPYYLIDVAEVDTHFHLYNYITHFFDAFNAIESQHKLPIICGGTGLYLDAVLKKLELAAVPNNLALRSKIENLDKEELIEKLNSYVTKPEKADLSSHKRLVRAVEIGEYLNNTTIPKVPFVDLNPIIFALDLPTELRRNKITARLKHRLENGMIEEVQQLLQAGISHERLQFLGLEYQYISTYLLNEISFDEMFLKLETAIHQYAKRQMTWFRKMEREQKKIHWLDATKPMDDILNEVLAITAVEQNLR